VGEGVRPQIRHARYRGVTQFHSTEEAGEQGQGATACGVGGGKGTDHGLAYPSRVMNQAFEDAAVRVARNNGLKQVTINVGRITNPSWRVYLESRG
jgi:hypothetical protein